jgi:hypothetical protein
MQTSKHKQFEDTKRFEQLPNTGHLPDGSSGQQEDTDQLVRKLFDSMQCSPLGRLLKVISTLPEVRTEKVERARRQIDQPEDCWDIKMNIALDRVIEELITEE